jgi:hypothetical protein
MTKQEMIDLITARYHMVDTPALQDGQSIAGMNFYIMPAYNLTAEGITRLNIGFAIEEEGGAGEAAHWIERDPATLPTGSQFTADIQAFIEAKIADSTILSGFVSRIDAANEKAYAWVVRDLGGTITESRVLLYRDGLNIAFMLIDIVVNTGD